METIIHKLHDLGQSIWCDHISRKMIDSGELKHLIDLGIVGVTSNPTIFMKAITGSTDYDTAFKRLLNETHDNMALYEGLVIPDIADAADILRPVYDKTDGVDGYVSVEVNPKLAYDTKATIDEARRLYGELNRPNIFIKVPATNEGIPAIETLIGEGISVNVTLIFGLEMYDAVMRAYQAGLQRLAAVGGDLKHVASVASFFVSRVDTLVDSRLEQIGGNATELAGKAAVANARLAYARFLTAFNPNGPWGSLASAGARVQRPLWASTSTKNPAYFDTLYVDTLVGERTVNTLPPATIDAVLDHGHAKIVLSDEIDAEVSLVKQLADLGIDMKQVTDQLLDEGVRAFEESFDELLANVTEKKTSLT